MASSWNFSKICPALFRSAWESMRSRQEDKQKVGPEREKSSEESCSGTRSSVPFCSRAVCSQDALTGLFRRGSRLFLTCAFCRLSQVPLCPVPCGSCGRALVDRALRACCRLFFSRIFLLFRKHVSKLPLCFRDSPLQRTACVPQGDRTKDRADAWAPGHWEEPVRLFQRTLNPPKIRA